MMIRIVQGYVANMFFLWIYRVCNQHEKTPLIIDIFLKIGPSQAKCWWIGDGFQGSWCSPYTTLSKLVCSWKRHSLKPTTLLCFAMVSVFAHIHITLAEQTTTYNMHIKPKAYNAHNSWPSGHGWFQQIHNVVLNYPGHAYRKQQQQNKLNSDDFWLVVSFRENCNIWLWNHETTRCKWCNRTTPNCAAGKGAPLVCEHDLPSAVRICYVLMDQDLL